MSLTKQQIRKLEAKYGEHNFCYQCGNPDLKPVKNAHLWPNDYRSCPKCGSSDTNA